MRRPVPRECAAWPTLALWGAQAKVGEGLRYEYKGGYWEMRAAVAEGKAEWTGCPNMWGENMDGAGVYA